MTIRFFFFILTALCVKGHSSGPPCSALYSMTPDIQNHGRSQPSTTSDYMFRIWRCGDRTEALVTSYVPCSCYKIRVRHAGHRQFKGFLVQARAIATNHRLGRFQVENDWVDKGFKLLSCSTSFPDPGDTVIHSNSRNKSDVEVIWVPQGDVGDIQFMVTVVESRWTHWSKLTPITGFLPIDPAGRSISTCPGRNTDPDVGSSPVDPLPDRRRFLERFGEDASRLAGSSGRRRLNPIEESVPNLPSAVFGCNESDSMSWCRYYGGFCGNPEVFRRCRKSCCTFEFKK